MNKAQRFTGTLQGVQRLKNTPSGNPRYRIFTMNESGDYLTAPDAAVNYAVTNHIGQKVCIELDELGRVIGMEPAA